MIETSIYLDTRRAKKDGTYPLRIFISRKGKRACMATGINLRSEEWENNKVVNRKDAKTLNALIADKLASTNRELMRLEIAGALSGRSAKEVLLMVQEHINPEKAEKWAETEKHKRQESNSFANYFRGYIATKDNPGTRRLYQDTYNKMEHFCNATGKDFTALTFDDITKQFIGEFEQYCLTTQGQNTASRHLRDIRAVLIAAIDDGKTTHYPFRKYRIKKGESRDKSLSAEELRQLFTYRCYPGCEQEAVDMFLLEFSLIGINNVDLVNLTTPNKGRIEYTRSKTHKPYSIKLEPEALAIIEKYKGKTHLLDVLERVPNYKTYFNRIGKALQKVGMVRVDGQKSTGQPILPDICMGSARTSWATIAQEELDIDRDTIAAALGHHTVDVTSTYLRTDWRKKVDEANRKVLDWVFHEKRKKRTRS